MVDDWERVGGGLDGDWREAWRTVGGLADDWTRIGGLEEDWMSVGAGLEGRRSVGGRLEEDWGHSKWLKVTKKRFLFYFAYLPPYIGVSGFLAYS